MLYWGRRLWPGLIVTTVMAVSACTDLVAYREPKFATNTAGRHVPVPCETKRNGDAETPVNADSCKTSSPEKSPALIEKTYRGGDGKDHKYTMAFVEFDDQGWFWDRSQMEGLVSHLANIRGEGPDGTTVENPERSNDFLILVYAHGWRHNARPDDSNVRCFSHLVERFDVIERKLREVLNKQPGVNTKPRHVVGVYVGWRGKSTEGMDPWELASFWERKSTAQRVGHGGVTEFLVTLNELRGRWNENRERDKTQLIIAGHSFGGKVIYSALSQLLVQRSREIEKNGNFRLETASTFGDLMVLVNPAFEGAKYEPLFQSAINRCYPAQQRPISLIVTSIADDATRVAFPMGQTAGNLFEETRPDGDGLQWDSLTTTVGHLDRYQTHKLEWLDKTKPVASTGGEKVSYREKLRQAIETLRGGKDPQAAQIVADETLPKDCQELGSTIDFENSFKGEFVSKLQSYLADAAPIEVTGSQVSGEVARTEDGGTYVKSKATAAQLVDFGDSDRGTLALTREPEYSARYPYYVVRTDANVIRNHNEFYTPKFVDFMQRFFVRHVAAKVAPDVEDTQKAASPHACSTIPECAASPAWKRASLVPTSSGAGRWSRARPVSARNSASVVVDFRRRIFEGRHAFPFLAGKTSAELVIE